MPAAWLAMRMPSTKSMSAATEAASTATTVSPAPDTSKMLLCPMPGVITTIAVKDGDTIEAGQALATVEAMKMENILKAEKRGKVKAVLAKPGQSLAVDELIMEFE